MQAVPGLLPSVDAAVSCFDGFRQKLYLRGVLGKKNDRAGDGRPYSMRKWTRWYVELRGPVLVFWNLLDPQLSAHLEDITAIVDGRVQPESPEFERSIAHIKNIVLKPNFINITDATCSIVGKLKKRDSVWMLHSSGANRFYMQAVDDRAMNEWVRALRLACFEAAKLYEYYTSALVNERYTSALAGGRASEYRVQVRFAGTNEWVACTMQLAAAPTQVTFVSQETPQTQLAVLRNPRSAYAIYPDSIESIDAAVIAKLEGDCDVDASLQPALEATDGDEVVASSRTHGSYALVLFESPSEMVMALAETASRARLYSMPEAFAPDVAPDRTGLYLALADLADKSVEIMEPVTARRMLDNLTGERCRRINVGAGSAAPVPVAATKAAAVPAANGVAANETPQTRMPWDSDDEEEATATAKASTKPKATKETEGDGEAQAQKRHFRFLHKSGKKDDTRRDSATSNKGGGGGSSSNGSTATSKHLQRQSRINSSTTSTKDSLRTSTSANEVVSQNSSAPSLPTPVLGSPSRGDFASVASDAIVNLHIADSPPPNAAGTAAPADDPPARRHMLESDTESEGDEPLGNIVSRAAQNGMAYPGHPQQLLQQQPMMSMHRASTAMSALGGPQQMAAMQQQQQPMSMYGMQMHPQQQQQMLMMGQDPAQMMGMPFQGPGSVHGRPATYMDAGGGMWGQQLGGGGGMESAGGPLLTVEKKVDPIERPTGLVGAIATREQMKSEQKYRDSSSLMKERQIRRNQAMGMNTMHGQQFGGPGRFSGAPAVPSMYGAPQGWADDNMSMMSGMSGRAMPYAQMAPSLSAEQLAGPYARGTMYGNMPMASMAPTMSMGGGGAQMGMPMGAYAPADNDDDVALSAYAGANGRASMAAPDVHPLRAAMQSGMSASSPHLAGQMNPQMNPYAQMQPMQAMQFGMQQPAYGMVDQQRRVSMAGMLPPQQQQQQRTSMAYQQQQQQQQHMPISPGTMAAAAAQMNSLQSRHSLVSSNSGSGSSGDTSPLATQNRLPANRWVKESSNLRVQSNIRTADPRSNTMPRQRGVSGANARANVGSAYELPNRGSATVRGDKATSMFAAPAASANGRYGARYSTQSDDDDDDNGTDSDDSDSGGRQRGMVSREVKQFFDVFVDKCLDVKPYAWLDFDKALKAYQGFCTRNGMRGKSVATAAQFRGLMDLAEWQLKTKSNGTEAYYNACLV
ncbi:hypothetical protein GGF46_004797 [Coemansia sp. RSA 552]|nr:hypothetical protein GGF46_004797 [Coemansia sp. RSA 552]